MELRASTESERGLYLAESFPVIERALEAGHRPRAFLLAENWAERLAPALQQWPDVPAYVADSDVLEDVTGFRMHRGALASLQRPELPAPELLLDSATRVVILDDLTDHTNVGAIFRSAAALGVDAVLLSPSCADPLYRRAVRVSMGAVLQVPWTRLPDWQDAGPMIHDAGFSIAAMDLVPRAEHLESFVADLPERLALVLGSEGTGISRRARGAADRFVTIPMEHGVDSLNVATAAAIALWAIRAAGTRADVDAA